MTFLLAALARYLQHWPRVWDILLWDEANHLGAGVFDWFGPPRSYELQALYSLLYKGLWPVYPDTIDLFYAVALIGVVSATLAQFTSVWLLSRNTLLAVIAAAALVGSGALQVTPRALFPAIAVLSLGMSLSVMLRTFLARSAAATLTLYLVSFLRPEFVLSFYFAGLMVVGAGALALARRGRQPTDGAISITLWALPTACAIALALLVSLLSFPRLSGRERAFLAFGQAFAWHWAQAHPFPAEGGLIWDQVLASALPGAQSQFEALVVYPSRVIPFLWDNVTNLPRALWHLFGRAATGSWVWTTVTLVALAAWAASALARPAASPGEAPSGDTARWSDVWLLATPLVGPTLSIVLVTTRDHYVLLWSCCVILILARVARARRADPTLAPLAACVAGALLFTLEPMPPVERPTLQAIRVMRSHPGIRRMFEVGHGWCAYLDQPCQRYSAFGQHPGVGFIDIIEKERVDAIVVTRELLDLARARGDAGFLAAAASPASVGWTRYTVGDAVTLNLR